MFRIVEDKMPPLPEGCSNLLRDFLTQCFHKDPSKRPDAETLCEHEWLKQNWAPHKVRLSKSSGRYIYLMLHQCPGSTATG